MVIDWQTAVGLVSALIAVVGWYCCQTWQLNRAASQDRPLPPGFRALPAGIFSYRFQATPPLTRGQYGR